MEERLINAYLIHPVTLSHSGGLDMWNEPLPPVLLPFMGRVDRGSKLVRNAQGEQVVASATVLIPKSIASVTLADRIITADGIEHAIITLDPIYDFSFSHWEVAIA